MSITEDSAQDVQRLEGEPTRPKVKFEWQKDENGEIIIPKVSVEDQDADEVSVSYVQSHNSINDDGTSTTESLEVKATRQRRRTKEEMEGVTPKIPKWEKESRERILKTVSLLLTPIRDLLDRDANEGDTRMVVNEVLVDALGYARYTEITTEYSIRGEFADYAIKIDEDVKVLIEVKRVGKRLVDSDVRQAESYALREGVEWVVLTNSAQWKLYHVTASMPSKIDLVFDVSMLTDPKTASESLFFLTKHSITRGLVDDLWKKSEATSTDSIREILLSDAVVKETRRELKRVTGVMLDDEEIYGLVSGVLH